jgi:hypothetical protein
MGVLRALAVHRQERTHFGSPINFFNFFVFIKEFKTGDRLPSIQAADQKGSLPEMLLRWTGCLPDMLLYR